VKKVAGGFTTYYIWEGAQVIAEYSNAPAGTGGTSYYVADRLSTRMITDSNGAFKGTQDNLPFGEEGGTTGQTEKHRLANYERDAESGTDYAVNRQYSQATGRFTRPDPVGGWFRAPQSFNRYAYALNDPVNLSDPLGLYLACVHEAMTRYLATLAGLPSNVATVLGAMAGDFPGFGADSDKYKVSRERSHYPAEQWAIHFPTEEQLAKFKSAFGGDLSAGTGGDIEGFVRAGHTLHAIEDGHGAHKNYINNEYGHGKDSALAKLGLGTDPDVIIGDQAFVDAANEVYQLLKKDPNARLTDQQMNELIDAIVKQCGKEAKKLKISRPRIGGGGRGFARAIGIPWWYYSLQDFLNWLDSIQPGWTKRKVEEHLA
jgi:RHS repeat-associated protein